MENFDFGKKDLLSSDAMQINGQSGINWKSAGGWAKALGVLLIVAICIMILAIFIVFAYDGSGRQLEIILGNNYLGIFIVFFLLILAIGGLLAINLIRFGNNIMTGVNNTDHGAFEKSMGALKNYFIISGIISILGVLITLINLFK